MKCSQSITQLAPALVAALAKIQDVSKSETAEVVSKRTGGKFNYTYATLPDTLQIARPILGEHKLAVVQFARIAEGGAAVEVETQMIHESGEWIGETLVMPLPANATPQEIGSAITYGRRYGIQPMLGMAAEDDDGGAATKAQIERGQAERPQRPAAKPEKPATPTPEQQAKAMDWVASIEEAADMEALQHRYKRAYAEVHPMGFDVLTNLIVAAKDTRKRALAPEGASA